MFNSLFLAVEIYFHLHQPFRYCSTYITKKINSREETIEKESLFFFISSLLFLKKKKKKNIIEIELNNRIKCNCIQLRWRREKIEDIFLKIVAQHSNRSSPYFSSISLNDFRKRQITTMHTH